MLSNCDSLLRIEVQDLQGLAILICSLGRCV